MEAEIDALREVIKAKDELLKKAAGALKPFADIVEHVSNANADTDAFWSLRSGDETHVITLDQMYSALEVYSEISA